MGCKGKMPEVPEHVKLIPGWFDDTLPKWKKNHSEQIKFLHVDSDLYSSCVTILEELNKNIVPGTVILFDELFGYPYWKEGEWKAFQEWLSYYDRYYTPIATARGWSGSVLVTR